MRAKIREILDDCIADGLRSGYQRARKYYDQPCEEQLISYMDDHIWLEIDRHFDFERNVCNEVVEGFDYLEQEEVDRLRVKKKQIYEDLKDAVDREWVYLTPEEMNETLVALGEAVYLLNPTDEDMQKKTGVYRVVTALEKLKEKNSV